VKYSVVRFSINNTQHRALRMKMTVKKIDVCTKTYKIINNYKIPVINLYFIDF